LAGGGTAGLEPIRITHPIPTGCKAQCLRCRGKIVLDVVQGYTCGDFAPVALALGFSRGLIRTGYSDWLGRRNDRTRHPWRGRLHPAASGGNA
jgi:hypothetical protein